MLEFRLLGPVEVSVGGRSIALRHRERALLALLALRVGETVSRDELVDALWGPSPPKTVGAALHNAVSQARKAVGEALVTRAPGYVLELDPGSVDAHRFVRAVASARASAGASERAEAMREALRLWRGRPLADLVGEPFADAERARLEELWLGAREDLVEAELAAGGQAGVLAEAEALVAEEPFSERARALLMLALYRSGRQADALAAYQAARAFLREELGLDPSPALRRLQAAMLRQDPALDPPDAEPALPVGEERRKTISVVFTDIVDSTALAAELDPEAYRSVLRRWYRAARAVLESHGGTVEKFIGDAVVGVYGIPRRHEDDAARAVRAAMELCERLTALNDEIEAAHGIRIQIRTAVNTGEAVTGALDSPGSFATGYAVSVAAKLQQAAAPGDVLLGPATYVLVRDAVEARRVEAVRLGSRGASLRPYLVASLDRRAPGLARRLDAPLVGRTVELAALRASFADALCEECPRLVTVVGEAGIGKSRLAAELAASLRDEATVVVGRCVSYGEGATYLPVAEIVTQLAGSRAEGRLAALLPGSDDARLVARRLRQLLGWADGAPPPGEGFWAVRRLLEARAAERPLLVILDDIHWAEATLLDLVRHLAEQAAGARLVLLCLARPDLVVARPEWPVTIALEPLTADEATQLVETVQPGGDLTAEARRRIVEIAEGNALFVEQLVAHVGERGVEALDVTPDSVESLLASRLDLLPETERAVLERAAVIGRAFWRGAVETLSERDVADDLDALAAKGLIRPPRGPRAQEGAYRFHHVLIRDVAYRSITKERRARLHEQAAAWLVDRDPAADEVIGYHLELAHRYAAEVGGNDVELSKLATAAGERLADAGINAWKRLDSAAAADLLGRAGALLPTTERRAAVLVEHALAQSRAGDHKRVHDALEEARAAAVAAQSTEHEYWAEVEAAGVRLYAGDDGDLEGFLGLTARFLDALGGSGDDRMLGRAWVNVAAAHEMRFHTAAWADAAERAILHYRRAGWPPASPLITLAVATLHGPVQAPEAVARLGSLLEARDDRSSRAGLLTAVAVLEAMQSDFAAAEEHVGEAREIWADLRFPYMLATTWDGYAAEVARLQGDAAGSRRILEASCEVLLRMDQPAYVATRAAQLGHLLLDGDDAVGARRCAELAHEHLAQYDVYADVLLAALDARLAAHEGSADDAEAAGRHAVELAEATDAPNLRARAAVCLAEVLRARGDDQGASEYARRALVDYEAKGNVVDAAAVRERLREGAATEA